ncbi:conserved hypothetical protein (plasmid) [Allomeiothermus silvanus DSM 9946]|uniref:Uncharacterized protein n=2 Tax=Allomeiothermus silvanus TaxID=52022 RepID=D7BJH8_ALLS1|nr:conserved hypothetical protein [Allomeiothermus silvanus DSM 9946]
MHVSIEIVRDSDTECPFDPHAERLVVFHRRYRGTHSFASPEEARRWAKEEGWKVFPVYAYIHSGVVLRASEEGNPFSDPWDSGFFGLLLLSRKEWGRKITLQQANALLDTYTQWANGDCWGYVVRVGNREDSCWGFIGEDAVKEAAQEAARRLLEEALEEELERAWKEAA